MEQPEKKRKWLVYHGSQKIDSVMMDSAFNEIEVLEELLRRGYGVHVTVRREPNEIRRVLRAFKKCGA